MGQLFQRTYKAKDGTIKTCDTWTIRYFRGGRAHQEPTKFSRKGDAQNLLRQREGDIAKGIPVSAANARYRFEDAVKDIVAEYRTNGRASIGELERRIKLHLAPWFGGRKMGEITTVDVRAFMDARLKAGAAPGEINREVAALKRMFSLAVKASVLMHKPHIPMLAENNTRQGFVDDDQITAILAHLPAALRPVMQFAYVTGWRIQSEILPMEWRQVDRKAKQVRLDPGTTKNKAGRVFPFTDDLERLFDALWAEREARQKKGLEIERHVFTRNGKAITSIRGAWAKACTAAGYPGRIPHDLRRSAVRNMERSGLSRSVAMQLTGHKTASVFQRYAITSEGDLQEAARRLNRDSFGTVGADAGRQTAG